MLQDLVQVDLLGAGVRKWCAPPFVHVPPPRPVVPRPRSHTLPPSPHLGAHRIPQPRFRTLPSARAQHPSPGLRLALFAHPSCLRRLLPGLHRPSFRAPPLRAWTPCVRSSPDAWPLRARTPCVRPSPDAWPLRARTPCVRPSPDAWPPLRGPPIARTPVPPALPVCAQEGWRACGCGEAWGRGAGQVEGTARAREGGRHRPLCLPGMCAKGEAGGRGEARRKPGGRDGEAQAEGQTEGGGAHCPSCPSPRIHTKGGGGGALGLPCPRGG